MIGRRDNEVVEILWGKAEGVSSFIAFFTFISDIWLLFLNGLFTLSRWGNAISFSPLSFCASLYRVSVGERVGM